ncbi:MAG: peptide-methionine (S)-S-oxide reductase MsrA [archaeon]|nr:peptide-methionine (S)-S-oxide reductase MsrA [archaeon]
MSDKKQNIETAVFAAGCFWGVEEIFRTLKGVKETKAGYSGGTIDNPTYEQVCTSATNHAEAIQIKFNPTEISYEKLLEIFWKNHNPTTLNSQGPDVGSQYRSVVFYTNEIQKKIAEKSKKEIDASGKFKNPIVTEIVPLKKFFDAEEYHQKYYFKRGITKTCHT